MWPHHLTSTTTQSAVQISTLPRPFCYDIQHTFVISSPSGPFKRITAHIWCSFVGRMDAGHTLVIWNTGHSPAVGRQTTEANTVICLLFFSGTDPRIRGGSSPLAIFKTVDWIMQNVVWKRLVLYVLQASLRHKKMCPVGFFSPNASLDGQTDGWMTSEWQQMLSERRTV